LFDLNVRERPANHDAKKDTAKPRTVRTIEDKDPHAPEQSFIVEQRARNLSDIDQNLKCPVDLRVYATEREEVM
jgi:hypothetical protein